MPERVVDVFEVVEIDEQDRGGAVLAARASQHLFDPVEDEHAVREPGQRVVECLVTDLVEQTRVADRGGGLTGESSQSFGDARVVEPFGSFGEDGTHQTDGLTIGHDRDCRRCDRVRLAQEHLGERTVGRARNEDLAANGNVLC